MILMSIIRQERFTCTVKFLLMQQFSGSSTFWGHNSGHPFIFILGSLELIKALVDKGVDVDFPSDAGSPLIWAAGRDHPKAVKLLLDSGANVSLSRPCK